MTLTLFSNNVHLIDCRRMGNFEHTLCTTVDAILEALGYEPTVVRQCYQQHYQHQQQQYQIVSSGYQTTGDPLEHDLDFNDDRSVHTAVAAAPPSCC